MSNLFPHVAEVSGAELSACTVSFGTNLDAFILTNTAHRHKTNTAQPKRVTMQHLNTKQIMYDPSARHAGRQNEPHPKHAAHKRKAGTSLAHVICRRAHPKHTHHAGRRTYTTSQEHSRQTQSKHELKPWWRRHLACMPMCFLN